MKRNRLVMLALLLLVSTAWAGSKRDPLTDAEADKLREARLDPYKRLKLFIDFTEARLDKIDAVRSDPKEAAGRGARVHDLIEDFSALIDEIDENLDMYQKEQLDKDQLKQYKKGLKELTSAENRFGARLRSLKHDLDTDEQSKAEARDYAFALQDAMDGLKASMETLREYAAEKEEEKPK
jgi:chromosome segregation ATPase